MILWVITYPQLLNIKDSSMQTLGKFNDTSATTACLMKQVPMRFTLLNSVGLAAVGLTAVLILMTGNVRAESAPLTLAADSAVENTGHNARDSGNATLTPEDQKETPADLKITAAIRKAVVKNKSLSLNAHNAKIITRNGVVTLRGPVENPAEKLKLQTIAEKTRGVKQVDNQLETKTP
jgi:osmotically-inducible protein OsmY